LCSSVRDIVDGEELRIGAETLSSFDSEAADRGRSDLVDWKHYGQMHAVVTHVVEFGDPVMTEVLLRPNLPLLEIWENCSQLELDWAVGGVRQT
jgi:hypothetical protein